MTQTLFDLALGQDILAVSSMQDDSTIIELIPTKVADMTEVSGNITVHLANNHNWGALPFRNRNMVASTEDEVRELPLKSLQGRIQYGWGMKASKYTLDVLKHDMEQDRVRLLVFYQHGRLRFLIASVGKPVRSLVKGETQKFTAGYFSVETNETNKCTDVLFQDWDAAVEKFVELAKIFL